MASLVVRGLDEVVKEKLRERARRRGHSLEAEVREILETASQLAEGGRREDASSAEKGFGTLMHERFAQRGFTASELDRLDRAVGEIKDRSMIRIPDFEK